MTKITDPVRLTVEGLDKVFANMKIAHSDMGKGVQRALKRAGALIMRESQKEVPVDTNILKPSAFIRPKGSGFKTEVHVGYSGTDYAIWVHEDLSKAHGEAFNIKHADDIAKGLEKPRGKGQKAKFLEDPVKRLKDKIIKMVRESVKVKDKP